MKRQWSEEEKIRIINAYRSSGLSQQVYAKQGGFDPSTLRKWIRRYGAGDTLSSSLSRSKQGLSFVELLTSRPEAGTETGVGEIEIVFPSQVVIKLKSIVSEELLKLVKALSHAHPSV